MAWWHGKAVRSVVDMQKRARALAEAGELVAARDLDESALRVMNASDDDHVRAGIVSQCICLGDLCMRLDDLDAAEGYYQQALDRQAAPIGDPLVDGLRADVRADLEQSIASIRARRS